MRVLKFGGTSVADAESIRQVGSIVIEKVKKEPVVVVVSALGGVTDLLVEAGEKASRGLESYKEILATIEKRHIDTAKKLIPIKEQSEALSEVKISLNELEDICKGIFLIRELTAKTSDLVLSYGELLSSRIINRYFQELGKCCLLDPRALIITDDQYGKGNVDFDQTQKRIKQKLKDFAGVAVCPGFVASNHLGEITTLGRGGSDYTAAIFAYTLKVKELEIWTDVSGILTSDPRMVRLAHPIEQVSYEEAMELSHFGAKVIYPPTIQPALESGIPIRIKNTFAPQDPGTLISNGADTNHKMIKGLSHIQELALLNLSGSGMIGIPNFSHRLFQALSRQKINVILITQASSEHSICVGIAEQDVKGAQKAINEEFAYEITTRKVNPLQVESDLAVLALVGSRMYHQVGVSGQMFSVLGKNGINIKAIAQGSSERNISAVINRKDLKKALNCLHESFFLSELKRINLFIVGVGNVGAALVGQLAQQQQYLEEQHHIRIRVVGLANSKKMYFDAEGIALDNWRDTLQKEGQPFSGAAFTGEIKSHNLRNSIFIDNTGAESISGLYEDVLSNTISVVTPNKVACTQDYSHYKMLLNTARRYKSHFLFETNVCAGLPVISTLNDLIKSGDRIHSIHAVLSGSLNFIFNHYDGERLFAEVVRQAKDEGYTEPDPRLDLSGMDVMRKILILIRESGFEMELEDLQHQSFIPDYCMEAESVDIFFERLKERESEFQKMLKAAVDKNCKLKFVASYADGKATTALLQIADNHPFYHLEGKDNIVLFYTDRYDEQPLVIKGAGAGPEVTASGIFADIMRIANAQD